MKEKEKLQTSLQTDLQCHSSVQDQFTELLRYVKLFSERESTINEQFDQLIKEKPIVDLTAEELPLLLFKLDLFHLTDVFKQFEIDGDCFLRAGESFFLKMGVQHRDLCRLLYYQPLIILPGFLDEERA